MNLQLRNICVAMSLCLSSVAFADAGVLIRPHAGFGSMDGNSYQHAGMRLLFDASSEKKYGLELTRVNTKQGDYLAAGIVLEKKVNGWFNLSIGTIGYLGVNSTTANVPGLVANLGWEPETNGAFKPFVTLRNDILFGDKTRAGTALSAGVAMKF
ncbi:MAG: hypothetical protein PHQ60_01280 [Sideroxydans sp.]|nr:hypothetical protein [Sideroxydans sp.]